MARQQDIMCKAVRDAIEELRSSGHGLGTIKCGANFKLATSSRFDTAPNDVFVMESYDTPIARVSLSDRDSDGHVRVFLQCRYYDYSPTTSRHLTYFLWALSQAGLIGQDVFARRAQKYRVAQKAAEVYPLWGARHDGFFEL